MVAAASPRDRPTGSEEPVYVYPLLVRVWHWMSAVGIVVLAVSGWFIAHPPPSLTGEAYDTNFFGTIRQIHFVTAYLVALGFGMRIVLAVLGPSHLREIFMIPIWRKAFLKGLIEDAKWYGFIRRTSPRHIGHNPMAQVVMHVGFVLPMFVSILTGFALYSEGLGQGSWADVLFGWMFTVLGSSQAVRDWHHAALWLFVIFTMTHLYAVVRSDIMGGQSMTSAMVSGWRQFRGKGRRDG